MKTLSIIIFSVILTACGCGSDEAKPIEAPPAAPVVASIEPSQPAAPVQEVKPDPIQICPQNSASCGPSPAPLPVRTIVTDPDTAPTCTRNTAPLVFIDPFWVDNCGNKYGITTI